MAMLLFCYSVNADEFDRQQKEKSVTSLTDKKRDAEILQLIDQLDKQLDDLPTEPVKRAEFDKTLKNTKKPIEKGYQELLLEDNLEALDLETTLSSELKLLENFATEDDIDDISNQSGQTLLKNNIKTKPGNIQNKEESIINTLDGSNLLNVDKELEKLEKKLQLKTKVKGPRIDEE